MLRFLQTMKKRNTTRAKSSTSLSVQPCGDTQDAPLTGGASSSMLESEVTLPVELEEEIEHNKEPQEKQQKYPSHSENPNEEQQKEEDIDLDEAEIEMVIAGGNDVIAQCRLLASDECPRIPLCR